jgi:hypothetical protein
VSERFANAYKAAAICDICGFRYPRRQLQPLIIKGRNTNIQACPTCWDPDQPQLHLGEFPVDDPQAIRNPRPTSPDYAQSRSQTVPVTSLIATGWVGNVTAVVVAPSYLLLETGLQDFLLQEDDGKIILDNG